MRKAWEKIIAALAEFDYLTVAQITRLLYSPASITHVHEQMKLLVEKGYVLTLGGRAVNLPRIYTLRSTGRHYASLLGAARGKRFRPSEEKDKGHNPYFLKHTIAVTDVLIAARLLADSVPAIRLTRMYTERELKRKIYIPLAGKSVCLEPDASLLFRITETWHDSPETWEDFFTLRSTAISRLWNGALSKKYRGMSPLVTLANSKHSFTHQRSPLQL
jgi:hypothetical protein